MMNIYRLIALAYSPRYNDFCKIFNKILIDELAKITNMLMSGNIMFPLAVYCYRISQIVRLKSLLFKIIYGKTQIFYYQNIINRKF